MKMLHHFIIIFCIIFKLVLLIDFQRMIPVILSKEFLGLLCLFVCIDKYPNRNCIDHVVQGRRRHRHRRFRRCHVAVATQHSASRRTTISSYPQGDAGWESDLRVFELHVVEFCIGFGAAAALTAVT